MLVAERYLGHRSDDAVAARLSDADPHRAVLSDTDRRRSRVRTETAAGVDLGVVVPRDLADGDVLATESGELVVVELATVDALVVDLAGADVSPTAALALGHAAGNRHWDLALREEEALLRVPDSRERMRSALDGDLPAGVTTRFESVPPTTFDGADAAEHTHAHGDDGHDGAHAGSGHDRGQLRTHIHDQDHDHTHRPRDSPEDGHDG